MLDLCRETGCPVHIVHVSAADTLERLRRARDAGLRVTAETCPHYLTFAAEEILDGATAWKCAPPIRERSNRERLWEGLADGTLDLVASDHSPAPPELKCLDTGNFARAWGGVASLELGLAATWTGARVGGRALAASDEFFAPRHNLLAAGSAVFIEGKYTDRGKWMDGWETRRRRGPEGGYDWCIIRLGIPGAIRVVTVDTTHFRGNYPAACSLDAAQLSGEPRVSARALRTLDLAFVELLPRSPLAGHTENEFVVASDAAFTHVRLKIYPDGGVARLRLWGEARPDWRKIAAARPAVDLVAVEHGGVPLATSDQFFSEPLNLIMPGPSRDMGDGWETRRRRSPGHDWVVLRLGKRGVVEHVDLDTTHFKGNFPESASLEGCDVAGRGAPPDDAPWRELVARTTLRANARHRLAVPPGKRDPVTHVRLNIFPDGGVARLRVWGNVAP